MSKKIPNISDCNLKKDYQILIIFHFLVTSMHDMTNSAEVGEVGT